MKLIRSLFLIRMLGVVSLAASLIPIASADLTPTPTPTSPFTGHECDNLHCSTNIAALGYATAESYRDQNKPGLAIDGDTESPFSGWMAVGDRGWWQVELPCLVPIYRVEVFTTPQNLSCMFPSFRISVSTTGAFAGEETIVATENQWPNQVMVGYDFEPIEARFIRLTALSDHHWSILQEFRAYPYIAPTRTPTPTPIAHIRFSESSPEQAGFFSTSASGMQPAPIRLGSVPPGEGTDGQGMIIDTGPGQGTLSIQTTPITVGAGPKLFTVNVMTEAPGASAALAVLNAPMGVDMGFVQASGPDVPVGQWGRLVLIYDPPDDAVHLGVQVALGNTEQSDVTVYYDNLTIQELPELSDESVILDANGSFDGDNANIFLNVNQNRGSVAFLADTPNGKQVSLSIQPADDAANVGIFATQLQGRFPHILRASVGANRLSGTGGVVALVMTNGYGNVGAFVSGDKLPALGDTPMKIMVGGGFLAENASFPIINVVQNGSTGSASAIIVDNLEVERVTRGL